MRAKPWASPLFATPTALIVALAVVVPPTPIKAAIKPPDIWQQMIAMGLILVDTPPVKELQHFVKSEIGYWGDLVRKIGIAGTE